MSHNQELALWTAASLLLAVAGNWLAWRFHHMQARSADWLRRRILTSLGGRLLLQTIRLLYYVGLPYGAVLRRALSLVVLGARGPEVTSAAWWLLGWSMTDWTRMLGSTVTLGSISAVMLGLAWRNAARAQGRLEATEQWADAPWWVTARETLFNEIHWGFYRVAPLLALSDAYGAILLGAAFPLAEWMLNPDWWEQVRGGPRRNQILMQGAWLAISTTCFALTRNLWLTLALHLVLALALNRWIENQDLTGSQKPVRS